MTRRGFALLSVLWSLVVIAAAALAATDQARLGSTVTRNRIELARARWAEEACLAILAARFADDIQVRALDTVDLGRGTWCTASLTNPSARLHLNRATREQLWRFLKSDSLVNALRDWLDADSIDALGRPEAQWYRDAHRPSPRNGPLAAVDELRLVRGFDSVLVASLRALVTVDAIDPFDPVDAEPRTVAAVTGNSSDSTRLIQQRAPTSRIPRSFLVTAVGGVVGSRVTEATRSLVRVSGARLATMWKEAP